MEVETVPIKGDNQGRHEKQASAFDHLAPSCTCRFQ
jgi:hypothetical protein